jgi:hypothetical protein
MAESNGKGSHNETSSDDDDEYEDNSRGFNLGFIFGNVDNSGDLDADYLDEDAKEHLSALADKLGSSLPDINVTFYTLFNILSSKVYRRVNCESFMWFLILFFLYWDANNGVSKLNSYWQNQNVQQVIQLSKVMLSARVVYLMQFLLFI